jgi:hypothetical protein
MLSNCSYLTAHQMAAPLNQHNTSLNAGSRAFEVTELEIRIPGLTLRVSVRRDRGLGLDCLDLNTGAGGSAAVPGRVEQQYIVRNAQQLD